VRSVTRFDEHDLILVIEVEWLAIIRSDGEVERGSVNLRDRRELGNAEVLLSNQFGPPESELGIAGIASRNEDRAVVDGNSDYIFGVITRVAPEGLVKKCRERIGYTGFGSAVNTGGMNFEERTWLGASDPLTALCIKPY
jgi:hypothetical protein